MVSQPWWHMDQTKAEDDSYREQQADEQQQRENDANPDYISADTHSCTVELYFNERYVKIFNNILNPSFSVINAINVAAFRNQINIGVFKILSIHERMPNTAYRELVPENWAKRTLINDLPSHWRVNVTKA